MDYFHGTSSLVLDAIGAGSGEKFATFTESNVSLGGAYLTTHRYLAESHALLAAGLHGGDPVVLRINPTFDLLPDEDWVVRVAETIDEDELAELGLADFMADLFKGYDAMSSLSDHYKAVYADLNERHAITAAHSLKWIQSARQAEMLTAAQVLDVTLVPAGDPFGT